MFLFIYHYVRISHIYEIKKRDSYKSLLIFININQLFDNHKPHLPHFILYILYFLRMAILLVFLYFYFLKTTLTTIKKKRDYISLSIFYIFHNGKSQIE